MHAARLLSQKRKHRLEQRRRSRLHRGFPNGDLSISEDSSGPWYAEKLDERRSAFALAKKTNGLNFFHIFAVLAFFGLVCMIASIFISSLVPGILEIGVSAFLVGLFCLIFVRCDEKQPPEDPTDEENCDDIVIETRVDDGLSKEINSSTPTSSEIPEDPQEQLKYYLVRSIPRRIPSPIQGYHLNFSPIPEMSEPSSCASSFLTRGYDISKLAKSSTADSLSARSNFSARGGGGPGSPIDEDNEEDHINKSFNDDDLENLSNYSNSASFDTETEEDSVTADLSVMTVIERKQFANTSSTPTTTNNTNNHPEDNSVSTSNDNSSSPTNVTPRNSFSCESHESTHDQYQAEE